MTTMAQPGTQGIGSTDASKTYKLIDIDVHERTEMSALVPYLEPLWRKYITEMGWMPDRVLPFTQFTAGGLDRADSKLADGRPGGSDLDLMRSQLFDTDQHDYAVLTGWLDSSGDCRIGERSSHQWFVLKYLLWYPVVANYDGSWSEWGNAVGAPVVKEQGAS